MLTVDFINVGYGDAILVRKDGFHMLVDCGDCTTGDGGPGSARISAAEFLQQEGVKKLDLLVLTHLHRDHSGGLTELLRLVHVKEFRGNYLPPRSFWGGAVPVPQRFSAGARCLLESLNIYLGALKTLEEQGTKITLAVPGAWALAPGLTADAFLEDASVFDRQSAIWQSVLEGQADSRELEELDRFINNTSVRLRLCCGGRTVELPGDLYADCWEAHSVAPCTVVKLPHHGHRDSMTARLLEMLDPECAVISVSNTRTDDCPSAAVLELLHRRGCPVHVTDAVSLDGVSPVPHRSVRLSVDPAGRWSVDATPAQTASA
ncbi:MAG: MBL fold metallo-hydrolase [Oscillibacter sp.]|nr:MBL fold metallo-hydrolase [Oscillibacter sp.]